MERANPLTLVKRASIDLSCGESSNPRNIDDYVRWFNSEFENMTATIIAPLKKDDKPQKRFIDITFGGRA